MAKPASTAAAAIEIAPLPDLLVVLLGSLVYFAVLLVVRGIPAEIWQAIRHRGDQGLGILEPPSR